MPDADEKTKSGICPNCHHSLHFLEQQQANTPFWHNTSRFFRFPFQAEPLLIIAVSTLLSFAYLSHYILALMTALFIIILVSHYGQQIIKSKQLILKRPPGLSAILSGQHFKESLSASTLIGIAILTPLLTAKYLSLIPALFLAAITFWFLPATLMVKLRQDKFGNALQIDAILEPMISMKQAYFGLVSIFTLTTVTSLVLIDFAHQHLPEIYTPIISAVTFSYFSLAIFSLLAYVLLEYKSFSNIEGNASVNKQSEQSPARALHEIDNAKRLDADIDIAIKRGDYVQLTTRLEKELKRSSFSDLRRDQLYKLLSALNDNDRLEQYAHAFLWLMIGRGKIDAASEFIRQRQAHNPEFVLFDLELSKKLAEAFHQHEDYDLVIWLAFNAHTRFDPAPHLAELYLIAAKTLLTKHHNKDKARVYLSYIINHFPDLPEYNLAKSLQNLIQKPQSIK